MFMDYPAELGSLKHIKVFVFNVYNWFTKTYKS